MKKNKAQIGVEYLIIVGMVTFVVTSILLLAFFYSNSSKDVMKLNQANSFAAKVIAACESTFYSGEPSKTTIEVYLPEGIKSIEILEDNLVLTVSTNSGISKSAFKSKVPITGNISNFPGIKKIKIEANSNSIAISNA